MGNAPYGLQNPASLSQSTTGAVAGHNRASARSTGSLFLDVIDDAARWRNGAPNTKPLLSPRSMTAMRGSDSSTAAADALQAPRTRLSQLLASGQTLGLERYVQL
jgi:hypothetical protein